MDSSMRRVVCAAVVFKGQFSGLKTMIVGARHYDGTMHARVEDLKRASREETWVEHEQGFIDQHNCFMSRCEAWKVAEAAGQILYRCGGDSYDGGTLYSENLY